MGGKGAELVGSQGINIGKEKVWVSPRTVILCTKIRPKLYHVVNNTFFSKKKCQMVRFDNLPSPSLKAREF